MSQNSEQIMINKLFAIIMLLYACGHAASDRPVDQLSAVTYSQSIKEIIAGYLTTEIVDLTQLTHDGPVKKLQFSPRGTYLVFVSLGKKHMYLYHITRGVYKKIEFCDSIHTLGFSPDEKYLTLNKIEKGSHDDSFYLTNFDAQAGEEIISTVLQTI